MRPILFRLCEKVGRRLRRDGLEARGVYLSAVFKLHQTIYATTDIFNYIGDIMTIRLRPIIQSPASSAGRPQPVAILAAGVFSLSPSLYQQQTLFEDQEKKKALTKALDEINNKFGEFSVITGNVLGLGKKILERIAFGGIRNL